jgi:O-acetyl-ADP-ribose deacetylase (regulator of RNase III)
MKTGDIFYSTDQVIVCPTNNVGVMGNGLALLFSKRFPGLLRGYKDHCEYDGGGLYFHPMYSDQTDPTRYKWILCFPTKQHWKDDSTIELISKGLQDLLVIAEKKELRSISFPKLGCGKGNLDFKDVLPVMMSYLSNATFDSTIYI